jgi:hypothetical protein
MECVLLAIASSILSGTALSAAIVVAGSKLGDNVVSPNNSESSPTLVNALEPSSQSEEEGEKDTMEVTLESASSQDSSSRRSNISSSLALFVAFVHQWNVWQRQIMGCDRSSKTNVDSGSDRLKGRNTNEVYDDDDDDESCESCDLADAVPPHEEEDGCFDKLKSILVTPPIKASCDIMSSFVMPKLPDQPTPMYPPEFDDNDSVTLCKKNR